MADMHEDIQRILFTEEQLKQRVSELGEAISRDFEDKTEPILLVSVLRGAYIFMADLSRAIRIPVGVDFMSVSSYGSGTSSSGQVEIRKDLSDSIEGMHVIVAEDILDSGTTLRYLLEVLSARRPASVSLVTLLDKPERRRQAIVPDYVGFTVPNEFIVGYGLDYAEKYRNLPYIGILKPEVYGG